MNSVVLYQFQYLDSALTHAVLMETVLKEVATAFQGSMVMIVVNVSIFSFAPLFLR